MKNKSLHYYSDSGSGTTSTQMILNCSSRSNAATRGMPRIQFGRSRIKFAHGSTKMVCNKWQIMKQIMTNPWQIRQTLTNPKRSFWVHGTAAAQNNRSIIRYGRWIIHQYGQQACKRYTQQLMYIVGNLLFCVILAFMEESWTRFGMVWVRKIFICSLTTLLIIHFAPNAVTILKTLHIFPPLWYSDIRKMLKRKLITISSV